MKLDWIIFPRLLETREHSKAKHYYYFPNNGNLFNKLNSIFQCLKLEITEILSQINSGITCHYNIEIIIDIDLDIDI